MAGTSYKITGIAPPDLDFYGPEVRKQFWTWVVEFGIKAKAKDIIAGLDKEGMPLKPIKEATRKHRKSEMTPSGKGDPLAPPLIPGWQKSRTYSLLAGRAFTSHAEFYWRFDAFTGDSWGEVLKHQAKQGRDVIGLSPVGLAFVRVQSWDRWAKYKAGQLPAGAATRAAAPARIPTKVGRQPTQFATYGIGVAGPEKFREGEWTGGMTGPEWRAYFRQTAGAALPGRPARPVVRSPIAGPRYNVLLGHVWGTGGTRPGTGPGTAAPIPVPRPSPLTPVPRRRVAMPPKPKRSFEALVLEAVRNVPEELTWHGKVWIHLVWEYYLRLPGAERLSLEQFKLRLIHNLWLRPHMSRADLVQAMDRADVAKSEVEWKTSPSDYAPIASWHFFRR